MAITQIDTLPKIFMPGMVPNAKSDVAQAIASVYRAEWRRIVAILIRLVGDFDVAEEAAQEAFTAAVNQWQSIGLCCKNQRDGRLGINPAMIEDTYI